MVDAMSNDAGDLTIRSLGIFAQFSFDQRALAGGVQFQFGFEF
jgi:hypothetical protein